MKKRKKKKACGLTSRDIVLKLCKAEGKKKQVDVAQMTETISHLADLVYLNPWSTVHCLFQLGQKRALERPAVITIPEPKRKARRKARRK